MQGRYLTLKRFRELLQELKELRSGLIRDTDLSPDQRFEDLTTLRTEMEAVIQTLYTNVQQILLAFDTLKGLHRGVRIELSGRRAEVTIQRILEDMRATGEIEDFTYCEPFGALDAAGVDFTIKLPGVILELPLQVKATAFLALTFNDLQAMEVEMAEERGETVLPITAIGTGKRPPAAIKTELEEIFKRWSVISQRFVLTKLESLQPLATIRTA